MQMRETLEHSEEQSTRLLETQNTLEMKNTQLIEMEAQLKVARVEIEKKDMLLKQLNGRMRDAYKQGNTGDKQFTEGHAIYIL